jgi:hypothetical protein
LPFEHSSISKIIKKFKLSLKNSRFTNFIRN